MFCPRGLFYLAIFFTVLQECISGIKKKGLQVEKDIKHPPYSEKEFEIFDEIVEIIGATIEDQTGLWLTFNDSCDPNVHRDKLSNQQPLENFYDSNFIQDLCSIFEDLACDTVEKVCKCWTIGGVGRMEFQPEFMDHRTTFDSLNVYGNENKPPGRCVMTARQRCGDVEMPPNLYPGVDFPVYRKLDCDYINGYKCVPDLDGISRCYYGDQINLYKVKSDAFTYNRYTVNTYIFSMLLSYIVL